MEDNSIKPEITEKKSISEISRGIASNALGKLQENVNKIKPDARFALGFGLGFGALALGASYLTANGINQAGGLESFIEIASMSIKDYQAAVPNSPNTVSGLMGITRTMPAVSVFFTGMTAWMGVEAYKAQRKG